MRADRVFERIDGEDCMCCLSTATTYYQKIGFFVASGGSFGQCNSRVAAMSKKSGVCPQGLHNSTRGHRKGKSFKVGSEPLPSEINQK